MYNGIKTAILQNVAKKMCISFPKSGRTWLRVLLSKYYSDLVGAPYDLKVVDFNIRKVFQKRLPMIYYTHFGSNEPRKNFGDMTILNNKKILFMVRDPRDVVVSFYFHCTKRNFSYRGELSSFIRDEHFGIKKIIRFNNEMVKKSFNNQLEILRYEDLKADTGKELKNVLSFFSIPINEQLISTAVAFGDFNNMKRMEQVTMIGDPSLKPGNLGDPDSYKVRKGKVGGYFDYFGQADLLYANQCMLELNGDFDYQI